VRPFATLALVTLGLLSGVVANAGDDPLPPFCSASLEVNGATVSPVSKEPLYHVEVPGQLGCGSGNYAVAVFETTGPGYVTAKSIRGYTPGGPTTFTVVKEVGPTAALCLFRSADLPTKGAEAASCVRLASSKGVVSVVRISPQDPFVGRSVVYDPEGPPRPECPSCW
jgi:hypothetical protein